MSAACPGCTAPIFWAMSAKGKKMPMDSVPAANGSFQLKDRSGENPLAIYVREEDREGKRLYTCHYGTCPNVKARVMK